MANKRLTCRAYLESCGDTKVVARLEPEDRNAVNAIVTEPGEALSDAFGMKIHVSHDRHYLVGEIADRLYAYEELGYSPAELQKILEEHNKRSPTNCRCVYVTTARQNGKSLLDAKKAIEAYLENDVRVTNTVFEWAVKNSGMDIRDLYPSTMIVPRTPQSTPQIENVIFNDPATIVFWKDGTKTVVKATNEDFDPEKGLAMAISKKALGNKHDYYNVFKKWLKKWRKSQDVAEAFADVNLNVGTVAARAANAMKRLTDALAPKVTKEDPNDLS